MLAFARFAALTLETAVLQGAGGIQDQPDVAVECGAGVPEHWLGQVRPWPPPRGARGLPGVCPVRTPRSRRRSCPAASTPRTTCASRTCSSSAPPSAARAPRRSQHGTFSHPRQNMERRAAPSRAGLARAVERVQCAIASISYRFACALAGAAVPGGTARLAPQRSLLLHCCGVRSAGTVLAPGRG